MIDVVVLTWRRPEQCKRCIESILDNSGDNLGNIHVVINEYNNSYNSVLDIEHPKLSFMALIKNEGVVARNHGFKMCTAEYIAQIDDDVVVKPAWDELALSMLGGDVKAVGEQGGFVTDLSSFRENNKPGTNGEYVDLLTGFCWVFKNEGFMYDEVYGKHWHEESDLQFQMRKAGSRFKVCERMCTHLHQGKPEHWEDHLIANRQRIVDKWYPQKDLLNLEKQ